MPKQSLKPSELKAMFLNEVPEPALLDTARCVIGSYAEAYRFCRDNFPGPEAHDLYPIIRRAMFERNWRARLSRYDGVSLTSEPNAAGNCFHTEMRAGEVVVTVSAVEGPEDIVREAVFRTGLARTGQGFLFFEPEPPPDDAKLYAILLHGPLGAGILPSPSFVSVAFPGSDCDYYVDSFNLLECFPVLRAEIDKLPKVAIQRKRPQLRRERERKAE